jgi:diphthine synthase
MLYLVGLGLDWLDISTKALERISTCDSIYVESYTSLSNYSTAKLSKFLGKKVISLNRKDVEEKKPYLKEEDMKDIVLLIYGDPLTATTHTEILEECSKKKIKVEVIHAPSVFTAVGETGLQIYKFGKTASIPFWEKNFKPTSFIDILRENQSINAHTLFLLDLRPEENKYLTISEAIEYLVSSGMDKKTKCIGCARLGMQDAKIAYGEAGKVAKVKYGSAPYCLIVPAKLHFAEEEFLKRVSLL